MLNEIYDNVRLYNSEPKKDTEDSTEAATTVVAKAEEAAEASEKK